MPTVCFTGGGSAGHVTPNLALIEQGHRLNWQMHYIGSRDGIEKTLLAQNEPEIPYHAISAGKLRRQLSLKNCLTPWQVLAGCWQAWRILSRIKPDVVFSKGGFVAFPVVFAAWCRRIPVVIHESDLTPGLANKLSFPFAKKVCVTFPEGKRYFADNDNIVISGTPIRGELYHGDAERGLVWCGFNKDKPVICVMGGGQGAKVINETIWQALPELCQHYQVVHLCGPQKHNAQYQQIPGYKQVDYVNDELKDIYACTDVMVSRAGANSLYEMLSLHKPHILIPLSRKASRGDQIANARYFQQQGLSTVIDEDSLSPSTLLQALSNLFSQHAQIKQKLQQAQIPNGTEVLIQQIQSVMTV